MNRFYTKSAFLLIGVVMVTALQSCSNKDELGEDASQYFVKYYGNTSADGGFDLIQTPDGGFALFGTKSYVGNGGADLVLLKTDEFGNLQWERHYGGPLNDVGRNFIQKSDGSFVMVGTYRNNNNITVPTANSFDAFLVWADAQGNSVQELQIDYDGDNPGFGVSNEEGFGITADEVGGSDEVFMVGSTTAKRTPSGSGADTVANELGRKDMFFVRVSQSSGIIADAAYGFGRDDIAYHTVQIPTGNSFAGDYLFTGYNEFQDPTSNLESQVFIGKFQQNGTDLFSIDGRRLKNGFTDPFNEGRRIEYVNENEIFITGWSQNSTGSNSSVLLLASSYAGFRNDVSQVTFFQFTASNSSLSNSYNRGFGLDYIQDGSVIISGATGPSTIDTDNYLLRVDNTGTLVWEKTFGGTGNEVANAVIKTSDGGYAMIGISDFESNALIQLIKTDPQGVVGN